MLLWLHLLGCSGASEPEETGETDLPEGCALIECDPDEGAVSEITESALITQFLGTCDPGDPVHYEVTTDAIAAQLELRIAHLASPDDPCPARESHFLEPDANDPLRWTADLAKRDTWSGCPGSTAEVCGPSTPGIARVLLLWGIDGRLADCAVYGQEVTYWTEQRGMSECYVWSR